MLFILQNSDQVQEEVDEAVLGGMGYTDCFLACVSSLKTEELIRRSPRGKRVGLLLDELDKIEVKSVTEMAILLVSQASHCISSGKKHKLPSASQASVWSTFHQDRGSPEMKEAWGVFVSTLERIGLLGLPPCFDTCTMLGQRSAYAEVVNLLRDTRCNDCINVLPAHGRRFTSTSVLYHL